MHNKKTSFNILYAISFAWQLGFLVAFPILGFGFLGSLIDNLLKTKSLLTIFGFLIGIGVAIYETINMLAPLLKKYD